MLQKLNERIQGAVAWLVIVLIAVTFTLFGVDYYLQSHQTNDTKVLVNGHPISMRVFEANYRRSRAQQNLGSMTAEEEKRLRTQVLEQIISTNVAVQAAEQYGFEVSINQANSAILNIPQFQEDGHFSTEKYKHALSAALFTPESFQHEVKQGMLLNQQRFAFMASSFALPDEIKRFVRLYMQTRDYGYLSIPTTRFLKQVRVSEEAIQNYFASHAKEFRTPEQVKLEYVRLSMPEIKKAVRVSEEEVRLYYDENKGNYLRPAQWQVAHILFAFPEGATEAEIDQAQKKAEAAELTLQKNPEQFNELVATLSDDKLSAADKGVMPLITAGQKEYDSILSHLTQMGQISKPERTAHGFEIFKLIHYKPAAPQSFAEVAGTIKNQLTSDRVQAKFAQALEQLSDLSYQTPDSLDLVAQALKLTVQKTEAFSKQGGRDPFTQNKLILNAAFNHDVLDLGNNSEPIQLDVDSVVVLRVGEHFPAKKQALAAVRAQIQGRLAKQAAEAKAKELGSYFLNPAAAERKQVDLLKNNQLRWHEVKAAPRDNDKVPSLVNDLAFNLSHPESRGAVVLPNGDYVVVHLKQINDGMMDKLDPEHLDSLIQQIQASTGVMDYDLYVSSLLSRAKIERVN